MTNKDYKEATPCFQEKKVIKNNAVTLARKYVESINKVRVIQQQIIPQHPISINNYNISSFYRPSYYASGDFFQYKIIDEDKIAIIAVDVIGKGLDASCITVFLKYTFQSIIKETHEPYEVMNALNVEMYDNLNLDGKASCGFYCILDTRNHSLHYCNISIGIARKYNGYGFNNLAHLEGLVLGASKNLAYTEQHARIKEGDIIIIGSNGLENVKDASGKKIKSHWFDKLMTPPYEESNTETVLNQIEQAFNDKTDYQPFLDDDVFCICIEQENNKMDDNQAEGGSQ